MLSPGTRLADRQQSVGVPGTNEVQQAKPRGARIPRPVGLRGHDLRIRESQADADILRIDDGPEAGVEGSNATTDET